MLESNTFSTLIQLQLFLKRQIPASSRVFHYLILTVSPFQVRHDYPSMLGSTWQVKTDMVKSFQRNLLAIKSKCPEAKVVLQIVEELFESENPEDLQGLIQATFGHKSSEKSPALKSLKVKDVEPEHPEVALLLLYRGQASHEVQQQVLEKAIAKWPHRSEFWYLLAEDLIEQNPSTDNKRALHAIRRSFSLSHFDRALVHRLLTCLEKLHRANEAALLWKAVAGSGSSRLWDDQRRTALAAISVPQVAKISSSAYPNEEFLESHPEFKFARDYMERFVDELLNEQLNIIRTDGFTGFTFGKMIWTNLGMVLFLGIFVCEPGNSHDSAFNHG